MKAEFAALIWYHEPFRILIIGIKVTCRTEQERMQLKIQHRRFHIYIMVRFADTFRRIAH